MIEVNRIISKIERAGFRYIGSGSGRIVYDLENGYVVKVAKNDKGIAQNFIENKISLEDSTNLFAKIEYASDDYRYLIMRKASKIRDYRELLNYFNIRNIEEIKYVKELQYIHERYKLVWGDLIRKSSWGIIDGQPVIVDYGLTRIVVAKYYI